MSEIGEVVVCEFAELEELDCREFSIGEGDWPFKGFVVRKGAQAYAYQNFCVHVGHPLNWSPNSFLTPDKSQIICASHGAMYEIESGRCAGGPCKGRELRRVECKIRDGMIVVRGPTGA